MADDHLDGGRTSARSAPAPERSADSAVRDRVDVIGAPIDALDRGGVMRRILDWGARRESRIVSICNAHSVVTARDDPDFAAAIRQSDLATPDGMPVVWLMRALGRRGQERVDGPDLMWDLCALADERGAPIYLYGSTPETVELLQGRLRASFPRLAIAGVESPPFRELTPAEDAAAVHRINVSGAQLVFVGLGCPRQEKWMLAHRNRVNAVMIGVGAAFDFHAGTVRRAPTWMQDNGLEWLHRLVSEPRRLWRRYLVTNSLFIARATRQLLGGRLR
jgi:N-acetylglucosaminyldiphosphoundecaprenol N-acetyl-beta-D-mannosaminyltransferase